MREVIGTKKPPRYKLYQWSGDKEDRGLIEGVAGPCGLTPSLSTKGQYDLIAPGGKCCQPGWWIAVPECGGAGLLIESDAGIRNLFDFQEG